MLRNLICLLAAVSAASAIRILSLQCISELQARFAITDVLSSIQNDNQFAQEEVSFEMYLPERAFITGFSIEMDGITTYGTIKEKDKARLEWEEARRNGEAAGHIEQTLDVLPRDTKKFLIKVNVPRAGKVEFNMTYQEMLVRENGVYKHVVNVRPHRPVDDIQVDVLVAEKTGFRLLPETGTKMHVPEFRDDIGYLTNDQLIRMPKARDVEVRSTEQPGGALSYVYFSPQGYKRVNGQLAILFDIVRDDTGGTIQTYDGYFLQTIAPENVPVGNKNVVFVIDKSGSMKGRKIAQVKKAMETILDDLHTSDNFNVLMFSKDTQAWVDTLVPANAHNVQQAKNFIQQSEAKGGTNIHDSIKEAMDRLSRAPNSNPLTSMVIFLTDGKATVGKKDRNDIVQSLTTANKVSAWSQEPKYAIHGIGFGNNADMQLLQQLAGANDGVARRVMADSDADVQLKGVFQQFSAPKLRDVQVKYLNGAVDVGSLVRPDNGGMFFDGGEVVVAGKVNNQQNLQFDSVVTGTSKNGPISLKQSSLNGVTGDCYPRADFRRPDGSIAPVGKHIVFCGESNGINHPFNPQPTTTASSNPRNNPFSRLGSRLSSLFGNDRSALADFFSRRRGGRGKRQAEEEGSGNGPDRPVDAPNSIGGFIERTWAYLTIQKLSKEADEWLRPLPEREEKKERAIALSLKYGFVSKYTSMVVVHNKHGSRNNNNNNNNNDLNELMDVPRGAGGGAAPQDDRVEGQGNQDAGKRVVNSPARDGKCRPGVVLVLDSRASNDLRKQRTALRNLVTRLQSDSAFTDTEFTVVQMMQGGQVTVHHSATDPQTASSIQSAIDQAISSANCARCPRGFAGLAPYLVRPSPSGVQKSFVIFTGAEESLGSLGAIMKGLIMPKVIVPAHNDVFSPVKLAELGPLTSSNQILYNVNVDDIVDLLKC